MMMKNLREALDQGKLKKFISERKDVEGDVNAFDSTLSAMAGKSSKARPASRDRDHDD